MPEVMLQGSPALISSGPDPRAAEPAEPTEPTESHELSDADEPAPPRARPHLRLVP